LWLVDDVRKRNFGEAGFSCDNRLKQYKVRWPAIDQLQISG
jgi:hypothetical protein